jgi:hypothetical protein
MTIRAHLRDQLDRAWRRTVERHYKRQRINSEASLQCSFWSSLETILRRQNSEDRRLFVEPSIRIRKIDNDSQSQSERRYPDLVVCSKSQIIAVIELKYFPRGAPSLARDLEKFIWLAQHRDQVVIKNERFYGNAVDDCEYTMSKNVLYVWCGIYKRLTIEDLRSELPSEFKNCFYHRFHRTVDTGDA